MNYSQGNKKQGDGVVGTGEVYSAVGQKWFRKKPCKFCGKTFEPLAPSHLYCCQDCQDKSYSTSRRQQSQKCFSHQMQEGYEEHDNRRWR